MVHLRTILISLLLAGMAAACSKPECEFDSDCGRARACRESKCIDSPIPPPPPPRPQREAGVDADADGGVITRPDASDASDDAGDGGVGAADADAGLPSNDGGFGIGTIWVFETQVPNAAPEKRATGEMQLYSAPPTAASFAMGDVACTLEDRRAIRPPIGGVSGPGIDITGFNALMLPGNSVHLSPSGPGRFDSGQLDAIYLFQGPGAMLTFTVSAGSANGELDRATGTIAAPTAFSTSMDTTVPVNLRSTILLTWNPVQTMPPRTIVAEIADADRGLVLRCVSPDRAMMVLPDSGRQAFLAASPRAPAWLELRAEERRTILVPIRGGGNVSTEIRASAGVRLSTIF
jgi:hypothetical protein